MWHEDASAHPRLNADSVTRILIVDFLVGRHWIQTQCGGDRYNLFGASAWDDFQITG